MNILTYQDIEDLQELEVSQNDYLAHFAYAVEAAVIAKLNTGYALGQSCLYYMTTSADGSIDSHPYYTPEQFDAAIAAARLQAINDAMNCYSPDDSATDWMDKIRALIGAKT